MLGEKTISGEGGWEEFFIIIKKKKKRKQPRRPSTDEWIKKLVNPYNGILQKGTTMDTCNNMDDLKCLFLKQN